ncbi:hypothetical protein DPM19_12175 [Actinomadura craniellae]|uniref:Uncharacterized protein n=1 Tax=Actinomadura craniellae TaxID=2231787 RepID=A0A365H8E3_9ACTN|nr:DUF6401 family natural product biosynthesis protein [Actinomadura craniellae]RAY14533.1 hypothetical protein DPM19_12175 [Actinomadura craniellae]
MTGEFADELHAIIHDIGVAGVAKMAETPGLAAEVDQHAAAVRDIVVASGERLNEASLLDYLHGFAEAAVERGWWPGSGGPDWEFIRVVAVCWLLSKVGEDAPADTPPPPAFEG